MNPADLHRSDTLPQLDDSPPSILKTLPALSTALQGRNGKAAGALPRIDTEPIYTQLKGAIGEHWADYKAALGAFMLGKLNQAELDRVLYPLLSAAPSVASSTTPATTPLTSTLHLHNTLIAALYANISRDPPPEATATWVLATDAPSAMHGLNKTLSGAAGAGDKAEERLKREVMALSVRDRRRIKSVRDGSNEIEGSLHAMQEYRAALSVRQQHQDPSALVSLAAAGPTTGLSKTNWDLEIRRRFAMPLAAETLEFPSRQDISARIEPICYEEGVGGGVATGSLPACAELVETAVEMFVKETLARWFAAARVNGETQAQTARFKRTLRREEAAVERGDLVRSQAGALPVEAELVAHRAPLAMDEVRLALRLDEGRLRQDPFLAQQILADGFAAFDPEATDGGALVDAGPATNGVLVHKAELDQNGYAIGGKHRVGVEDPMAVDDNDWGWRGGSLRARNALMDVLDRQLAVGS